MKPSLGLFMAAALALGTQMSASRAAAQESEDVAEPLAAPAPESTPVATREAGAEQEPASNTKRTAKNVLYVELGGNGILYSLNYERFVTDDINIRLGLDYFSVSATDSSGDSANATFLVIPVMFNYMGIGTPNHKLELGVGLDLLYLSAQSSIVGSEGDVDGFVVGGTATIGYRYVPHDGGFNFKVGFTPVFAPKFFQPWGGLGFGAVF